MTWRRVHDLLGSMPHDAAWRRSVSGRDEDEWAALAPWGPAEFLLAHLIDAVRGLTYVTLRAHGAKDARPPEPIPRPTLGVAQAAQEQHRVATADEIAAFVRRRKAG